MFHRVRSFGSIMNFASTGEPRWVDPAGDPWQVNSNLASMDRVWINQITYWHLLSQILDVLDQAAILVQGLLARDGERVDLRLGSVYQLDGRVDLQAGEGGEWAIVLRDAAGAEISRHPFTPVWWLPDAEIDRNVIGFDYRVPDQPGVAAIELLGPGGLLDRRVYSANAPTVRVLAPAAGASVPAGALRVEWEGADADGDALLYSVFYSAADGATWHLRALEQTANSLAIEVAAGQHRVRVLATDGACSAEVISTFAVV